MTRTYVMLDGLQDPLLARQLSARWAAAGFNNAVDAAGQSAWLAPGGAASRATQADAGDSSQLTESAVARAAAIARIYGVELRDRVGNAFEPANDLHALRAHMAREYKARFAQSLVFGLPALAVHYLGPMFATGGGAAASSMIYPWLIEAALVGWLLWVAGLPLLWQGAMSVIFLRATADLLVTVLVLASFVPSLVGVLSVPFAASPWFGPPGGTSGPTFHVAALAIMLTTLQRWLAYRRIEALSGRANRMLPRYGGLIAMWLVAMIVVTATTGWWAALAFGLLLPPMLSLGAINSWSPGWSVALPVLAFAPLFVFGPRALNIDIESTRIEIAAAFQLMMALTFAAGWARLAPIPQSATDEHSANSANNANKTNDRT